MTAWAVGTFGIAWPGEGRHWMEAETRGIDLGGRATWYERFAGAGGRFGLLVTEGHSTWGGLGADSVYEPKTYRIVNAGDPLPDEGEGWHLARIVLEAQPGRRYAQAVRDLRALAVHLADGALTVGEARLRWQRAQEVQRGVG